MANRCHNDGDDSERITDESEDNWQPVPKKRRLKRNRGSLKRKRQRHTDEPTSSTRSRYRILKANDYNGNDRYINAQSWSYNDQQAWDRDYPMCNGSLQSPIRINSRETNFKSYPAINFINYNQTLNVEITNNGYSAEIDYPERSEKPKITGGPLPAGSTFELSNVHFHWGANDTLGAEHVIDMRQYAMEVHTVHYNMKYSNVDQALMYSDGIAVITVFYLSNPAMGLDGLQPVVKALPQIINSGDETVVENFNLSALIGGPGQRTYYTYPGSLTTPPCSEAVTWIIYPKPLSVQPEQLESFRALKDKRGNPLVNNFRQIQKRNRRKVYRGRNKSTFPLISTDSEM